MFKPSSPHRSMLTRTSITKDESVALSASNAMLQEDLAPPARWVDKQSRSKCFCCSRHFQTLLRPKYNCRKCGEVVCSKCRVSKLLRPSVTAVIVSMKQLTTVQICLVCSHSLVTTEPRQTQVQLPSSTPAITHFATTPQPKPNATPPKSPPSSAMIPSPYDLDWDWAHPWPKPPALPSFVESQHKDVLNSLRILDTPKDESFDRIAIAARKFTSPPCKVACVGFMDLQNDRQWFKATCGLAQSEMPRTVSFCTHTLYLNQPVVVLDARVDERFCFNPLVTGAGQFRFYASVPIVVESIAVGTIFVLDAEPRTEFDVDMSKLVRLGHMVSKMLVERRLRSVRKASLDESFRVTTTMSVPCYFDEDQTIAGRGSLVSTKMEKPVRSYSMDILDMATTSCASQRRSSVDDFTTSMPGNFMPTTEQPRQSSDEEATDGSSMETMLMTLLSQTTLTQQQIATQQGDLYVRLGSNSTKLNMLTEAVARMEAKLQERQTEGEETKG
ncbi:hypothetical protein DYB25_005917 [Aphanomyces astaci]|uniref:FYVE-type domain-containing protein n=2 Tax=Aphanomyces astaci TaxID=112090 RepID=A0A397BY42_APHAT|nr:hypothetical protein DYB25_005917 [Aphanomyces astaci]